MDDQVGHDPCFRVCLAKGFESVKVHSRKVLGTFDFNGIQATICLQNQIDLGAAVDTPMMDGGHEWAGGQELMDMIDDPGFEKSSKQRVERERLGRMNSQQVACDTRIGEITFGGFADLFNSK